jgi:hypothetical protein
LLGLRDQRPQFGDLSLDGSDLVSGFVVIAHRIGFPVFRPSGSRHCLSAQIRLQRAPTLRAPIAARFRGNALLSSCRSLRSKKSAPAEAGAEGAILEEEPALRIDRHSRQRSTLAARG